ncbi:MAG: hypothetical protein ACRD63_17215 [Pyrinomonadaceae bacterium]
MPTKNQNRKQATFSDVAAFESLSDYSFDGIIVATRGGGFVAPNKKQQPSAREERVLNRKLILRESSCRLIFHPVKK